MQKYILTPGPTEVPKRIRNAMMKKPTNPDLDKDFLAIYQHTRVLLEQLLNASKADVYIMMGEAMLGLEAAVANLVEGEKVLVVDNGVFGEGFAGLVEAYGGKAKKLGAEWRKSLDVGLLEKELERKDYSMITLVHCDTPSALLNPLEEVAELASEYGALLIVDAVSSMGAVEIDVDRWGIDVLIGGSQKVFNVPAGLTIITVSEKAWDKIEKKNYRGFYMNLKLWEEMLDERMEFPYTMNDLLVYGLNESLNMIFEEGVEKFRERHERAKRASYRALDVLGLEPYVSFADSSPTVTAFFVPEGIDAEELREHIWKKYGVMLGGSWGKLKGKIMRIGQMGVQASRKYLEIGYKALAKGLRDFGYEASVSEVLSAIEEEYAAIS